MCFQIVLAKHLYVWQMWQQQILLHICTYYLHLMLLFGTHSGRIVGFVSVILALQVIMVFGRNQLKASWKIHKPPETVKHLLLLADACKTILPRMRLCHRFRGVKFHSFRVQTSDLSCVSAFYTMSQAGEEWSQLALKRSCWQVCPAGDRFFLEKTPFSFRWN